MLVTTPDIAIARELARLALEARLCACAQLIPGLESHYWWQGKLDCSQEVLVVFKTLRSQLEALESLVLKSHPYDTPQFVVLDIVGGSQRYLDWLDANVQKTR